MQKKCLPKRTKKSKSDPLLKKCVKKLYCCEYQKLLISLQIIDVRKAFHTPGLDKIAFLVIVSESYSGLITKVLLLYGIFKKVRDKMAYASSIDKGPVFYRCHQKKGCSMFLQRFSVVVGMLLTVHLLLAQGAEAASFQGKWKTNLGTLLMYQNGDQVQGTYSGKSGRLEGTVSGKQLRGAYFWKGRKGVYELVLNENGTSFSGKWSRGSRSGRWTGRKIEAIGGVTRRPPSFPSQTPLNQVDFNSSWRVEDAADGKNQDYHRTLWTFSSDGTLHGGRSWRGLWGRTGRNRIKVILMDTKANTDEFEIAFFNNGSEFTAFKNGKPFRYGRKSRKN